MSRMGTPRVQLPARVQGPIEVYINGVRQREGDDFTREGDALVFARPLAREGRLGFWRWASMFLGIAGTYRRNDTIDVVYEQGGKRLVETGLPFMTGDVSGSKSPPSSSA